MVATAAAAPDPDDDENPELSKRPTPGDKAAEDQTYTALYAELKRLAAHYLKGERPGHTLQPTALVNEAFLRFASLKEMQFTSRSHFFAMAARLMRRILIDLNALRNQSLHWVQK